MGFRYHVKKATKIVDNG